MTMENTILSAALRLRGPRTPTLLLNRSTRSISKALKIHNTRSFTTTNHNKITNQNVKSGEEPWTNHTGYPSSTPPPPTPTTMSTTRRFKSTVTVPKRQQGNSEANAIYESAAANALEFDDKHNYTHTPLTLHPLVRQITNPIRPHIHSVSHPKTIPKCPNSNSNSYIVNLPPYALTGRVYPSLFPERITLHNDNDNDNDNSSSSSSSSTLHSIRHAARLAREMLEYTCTLALPGVSTDAIDTAVHEAILKRGAYPSPLNYAGFPKSLCSSVNEVVCHGIPDSRLLREGDIVSFDVSCFVGGVHGDNCATVIIGDVEDEDDGEVGNVGGGGDCDWRGVPQKQKFDSDAEEMLYVTARRLSQATLESLNAAISTCGPGSCLTQVGEAISCVAEAYGYDSVEKYRGHGIGTEFHCAPFVKHFRNDDALELQPGMVFTIEPMLTEGRSDCVEWQSDGWTVVTKDGGRAAQFEHMVYITETGAEILTTLPTQ